MNLQPIGIFDSGVGGTSIWKELRRTLPDESMVYLADSANAPYGERSPHEILKLCIKNTELLLEKDCKLIVVACNTATTNAIAYLRDNYSLPFIGIEPAIKPAALNTSSGVIGVLATRGTLSSELFARTSGNFAAGIRVIEQFGDGLVPLIEAGKIHSEEMTILLHQYLDPMIEKGIDHLVLGCTHYPYLIDRMKSILPEDVKIIDSGQAVARQTKRVLEAQNALAPANDNQVSLKFYTNADKELLRSFLNDVNDPFEIIELDF
ncbi:glutamate racemase [Robertkochia marina]|uniref:Glutamate racemase n=1 Tax=Robertkochia marina TaxID=1227945 RepID=A0A4S3M1R1_9FLAO|nr:glutamate racemase [Robertkochia marina]THD68943.1 glutamate racemase [Robertkochia marina]TRZ44763.1 glutamate racemase [Robertkochia marina]